jgi:hypothetical protein
MIAAIAALAAASSLPSATYPAAIDRAAISAWLPRASGLTASQVIAVTASSAVAIVSRTRTPDGRTGVVLRALPLTPEATARGGVLAWQMHLDVDCRTGAVRIGATTGFDSQRADGEGVALAPAQAAWRPPKSGTPLESARRAVCERDFQPPLVVAGQGLAPPSSAPTARPAPAPPPAPLLASLRPSLPAPFTAPNASLHGPSRTTRARPGLAAVQVVSSGDETETRQALARLQGRLAGQEGLQSRVEPAQVRGRTVYRGMITGFGSREAAQAFCETLKRRGRDCLAR